MDKEGWTPKQMFARIDANTKFLWDNTVRYAEFPPLVPPILAQESTESRNIASSVLHHADTNTDIVEPLLFHPEQNETDREIYERVCPMPHSALIHDSGRGIATCK